MSGETENRPRSRPPLNPKWSMGLGQEEQTGEGTTDSSTFGQLKKIVAQPRAKPREPKCDYVYKDREDLISELEDWYEYSREPQLTEALHYFRSRYRISWRTFSNTQKQEILGITLQSLRGYDMPEIAQQSMILFYLVNGCYAEVSDRDHQAQLIKDNCAMVIGMKPTEGLLRCLRDVWERLNGSGILVNREELESILSNICTILFFLLGVALEESKLQSSLAAELRSLETSLTSTLIEYLAQICDVENNHITSVTIRHLSMLLRQTILCTLGGTEELTATKIHRRRKANLPVEPDKLSITTTPLDYAVFRSELMTKYPCYKPPPVLQEERINLEMEPDYPRASRQAHMDLPVYADGQWSATPAPSPPPSPKGKKSLYTTDQTLPFILPLDGVAPNGIPSSIEEAAALFESRQRTSLPLMQLWQEQEHFIKSQRGWTANDELPEDAYDDDNESNEAQRLDEVERIYAASLPHLQNLIGGLISQLWTLSSRHLPSTNLRGETEADARAQEASAMTKTREWLFDNKSSPSDAKESGVKSAQDEEECRELEITLKGVTGSILWLLKWFKISHILKFEYLSQLLIDADWIPTLHQVIMSLNPVSNIHVSHEDSRRSYFNVCASLSEVPAQESDVDTSDDEGEEMNATSVDIEVQLQRPASDSPSGAALQKTANKRVFYDIINLLAITQKIVKRKTHRHSLLVQAKAWLHLRRPLRISHDLTQLYCLKLYKAQVPLCSRKWRQGNMKIITQIYLSCRPELREDWIAGTDADTDFEEAKQQENAIRALILHYNTRRYPQQMGVLGFADEDESDSDDDFFQTEVSRMRQP